MSQVGGGPPWRLAVGWEVTFSSRAWGIVGLGVLPRSGGPARGALIPRLNGRCCTFIPLTFVRPGGVVMSAAFTADMEFSYSCG